MKETNNTYIISKKSINLLTNRNKLIIILICLLFKIVNYACAERNLIPRLPEIIIEKGYSEYFTVNECKIKAKIENEIVKSKLFISILNTSQTPIESTIKIRALYLLSDDSLKLKISGQTQKFTRKNNRYNITLEPNKPITFEIEAIQNILYNLEDQINELKNKKQRSIFATTSSDSKKTENKFKANSIMQDLIKYFDNENYTKALSIGTIVSKWGVFPVNFNNVNIELIIPNNYEAIINSNLNEWNLQKRSSEKIYSYQCSENCSDKFKEVIFIVGKDALKFRELQKYLSQKIQESSKFQQYNNQSYNE